MEIRELEDGLEVSGIVNITGKPSKELRDSEGSFYEVVQPNTFANAIKKRNVKLLFNHKWDRELSNTEDGLELWEDSLGLHFRALIKDSEVIEIAKRNAFKGMSFGFNVIKQAKEIVLGKPMRFLEDIDLYEVSLLSINPAYDGCIVDEVRSEDRELTVPLLGESLKYQIRELSYETKEEIIEDVKSDEEDQEKEILIDETLNDNKASEEDVQEASKDKAENQLEMIEDLKKFIITEKIKSEIKGLRS